jgi:activator of 2-hydroxyglutaryl-CoA dehydratase
MDQLLNKIAQLKTELTGQVVKDNEIKDYLKNANEVEHTTNTGYGKELIPTDTFIDSIYNAIPERSKILPLLMD